MEKYFNTISDGVTFTAIKTDKSKYDLLTVNFILPLTRENAAFSALLTAVINRGTVKYPDMRSLAIAQEELYAASAEAYNRVLGECISITFSVSGINKAYTLGNEDITPKLFELLHQLIFCPLVVDGGFNPEYVESEKKNQIDIIRSRTDNKSSYAVSRCIEIMCKNEAYSVSSDGKEEDVKKINGKNLFEFYQKMLSSAPVHAVFTGNIDEREVEGYIKAYLPFSDGRGEVPKTEIVKKADKIKSHTEKMKISQSKLCIGYRTGISLGEKDWLKFLVFDEIFAASPTSKLFMNVREKMSLCYYCSPVPQSIKGILIITAGINARDKDKVYGAVTEQLEDMKNGAFSDTEFTTAVKNIKSNFRSVTDTVRAMNSFYLSRFIAGVDISPWDAEKMMDGITRDDVVSCAKNITADTVYFLKGGNEE